MTVSYSTSLEHVPWVRLIDMPWVEFLNSLPEVTKVAVLSAPVATIATCIVVLRLNLYIIDVLPGFDFADDDLPSLLELDVLKRWQNLVDQLQKHLALIIAPELNGIDQNEIRVAVCD